MANICLMYGIEEWLVWATVKLRQDHNVRFIMEGEELDHEDMVNFDLLVVATRDAWERVPQDCRGKAIALCSISPTAEMIRSGFKAGFHDVMDTPFSEDELLRVVATALNELQTT